MIISEREAVKSLENLNDTLSALERPVELNIFDAVGMATQEVKHSAFLAWLLDPRKPHNKGGAFLADFLSALYDYPTKDGGEILTNAQIIEKSLTRLELSELAAASDITVATEKVIDNPDSRIDIFIYSASKNTVVVIENKVFTSTHDDQLNRYEREVAKLDGGALKKLYVYLTPHGEMPTDIEGQYQEHWCVFDYGAIIDILKKRMNTVRDAKLKFLIKDYIAMVDDKILHNNPTIRALCKQIRRDHADALEILLNYSDNVDTVYRYIAESLLPVCLPQAVIHYSGRKLVFYTPAMSEYYARHGQAFKQSDGLYRFQVSVASKDGPITIGMWLAKTADGSWTDADIKIRDMLQPQKTMGAKYCTLYSKELLSAEERDKNFVGGEEELKSLIESRLKPFIGKVREVEAALNNL